MQNIEVSGSGGDYITGKVSSKLALPIDLSESVEEVRLIHEDANLSNFQTSVLNLVKNDQKVLIILVFSRGPKLVKSKLPQDSFIVHKHDEANEGEACEWISGRSSKKFLIADADTVAGYEFDTVIILSGKDRKNNFASLCQRATSRLIVCFIG